MELEYYKCNICGNLFEIIDDGSVVPICCSEDMTRLEPNTTEAKGEYHIPEYTLENNKLTVKIGKEPHPMTSEHYIEFISVKTSAGEQKKYLTPNMEPTATFELNGEKVENVYCYCNLHGLWKK